MIDPPRLRTDADAEVDDDDEDLTTYSFAETRAALVAVFTFLLPFLARYRRSLAFVGVGLLIETAFNVLMPVSLKVLIDDFLTGEQNRGGLLIAVLAVLAVAGLSASAVAVLYERTYARVAADIVGNIRSSLFLRTQTLSTAFYGKTTRGEVLSRFSVDMAALEEITLQGADAAVLPLLELLAAIILLIVLNWELALIAMLVFPIVLVGPRLIAPYAVTASHEVKRREASALSLLQELVSGQSVIKAFGLQRISARWFAGRNDAIRTSMGGASFYTTMIERSVSIAILLLHLLLFGVGAYLTYAGEITLGTFVTFENVFWELSYNVARVMQFTPSLIRGAAGAAHIEELFRSAEEEVDRPGARVLPRLSRDITFADVSFGYDAAHPFLSGLDFTIPAGRRIAIVGPSGGGKSTILKLLLRLHRPTGGRILFDGIDIAEGTIESLRAQIAVVFQESLLFGTTLRENIRLGRLDASDEEVVTAAEQAEIHRHIVGLPQGYETVVGERGDTLSGGQRQRIAIARALLRQPAILLLDEAMSALDQTTENALNETFREIMTGRTVLLVTHRLTTAAEMDAIIVLENGRIVEQGSHAELLGRDGPYSRLWHAGKTY